MNLNKFKVRRIVIGTFPLIIFLLIHIAFYWVVYEHNPFELNYFKTNLSGFIEIYLTVSFILVLGIMIKAKYFCILFFLFTIYGEIQMLFGYWKLGTHPTMGPAIMQFVLYLIGFILGSIIEITVRTINTKAQRPKQS